MGKTLFIGNNFINLSAVGSTNTYAQSKLVENPPEGTAYFTSNQTQGRGQKGNSWQAAPGQNIAVSIVLFPKFLPIKDMFYLSKITSLAVQACIQSFLPEQLVNIKWPNDTLVGNKKLAGILIENQIDQNGIKSSILGIGINVNQVFFSPAIQHSAGSLRQYIKSDLDIQTVCQRLFEELERWYLLLKSGNKAKIDQQYYQHLYGYQEEVEIIHNDEHKTVILTGVLSDGRLATQQGNEVNYYDIKEISFVL